MTDKTRSIYARLADAREQFHNMELEKTGYNSYGKYNYFELGDFLIPAMKCLKDNGLVTLPIDFGTDFATMTLCEIESDVNIFFRSPMSNAHYVYIKDDGATTMTVDQGASLRGCHPIQNTGAVQTYQRKYLWISLMEIVEHDALDSAEPIPEAQKVAQKITAKSAIQPVPETGSGVEPNGFEEEIATAEDADRYVDSMIDLATKEHTNSTDDLMAYWQKSTDVIKYINDNFPDAYEKLRENFTAMKAKITRSY